MTFQIVRGDTYVLRRPFLVYDLVDDTLSPFDLTGCTIRTTWKVATTDPNTDTTDADGVLKGTLVVDGTGTATTEDGLYMVGLATDGTIEHRLPSADTLALDIGVTWVSDLEVTDANGEVSTFFFDGETATAIDGYTNRTTG